MAKAAASDIPIEPVPTTPRPRAKRIAGFEGDLVTRRPKMYVVVDTEWENIRNIHPTGAALFGIGVSFVAECVRRCCDAPTNVANDVTLGLAAAGFLGFGIHQIVEGRRAMKRIFREADEQAQPKG